MTGRRIRLLGTGLAVVAVIAAAWLLGIGPLLGQAAASETQLVATTAVNDAQSARLAALAATGRHLADLQAQLKGSEAALPAEPQLAAFFSELGDLQRRDSVTVTGYTGSAAVAATGSTAAAGASGGAAPTATPAPTASPSASASPSPAPSSAAGSPATAAPGTPTAGLSRIPMQLQVAGSYKHLVAFVGGLQSGPRLFLVDRVAISSGTDGSGFTATVSGSVYVLPTGAAG